MREATLVVRSDPRLMAMGALPSLVSNNPNIHLEIVTKDNESLDRLYSVKQIVQVYHVILSPETPIGPVTGLLAFLIKRPASPLMQEHDTEKSLRAAFATLTASIGGEVFGKLSATPNPVVFGTVHAGQASSRDITLFSSSSEILEKLDITCSDSWIKVEQPAEIHPSNLLMPASNATKTLRLLLDGEIPLGDNKTTITIVAHDGERLAVPIWVYVSDLENN